MGEGSSTIRGLTAAGSPVEMPIFRRSGIVDLSKKELAEVDLTPLEDYTELRILELSMNSLRQIDLSPLSNCPKLEKVALSQNRLSEIDLSYLRNADKLTSVTLNSNSIDWIDLGPLDDCSSLETLLLSKNRLREINLEQIRNCMHLQKLVLGDNAIAEIELDVLGNMSQLVNLGLYGNHLATIDLAPLSACKRLEWLLLSANHFEEINLSPLSGCSGLYKIDLKGNRLNEINLDPISSLPLLAVLDISGNNLETVDLGPFWKRAHGRVICGENRLTYIDITPTLAVETRTRLTTDDYVEQRQWYSPTALAGPIGLPMPTRSWSFLRKIMEDKGNDLRIQHCVYYALGFSHFGFIDIDLQDELLEIKRGVSFESAKESVFTALVGAAEEQISGGGPTTGMNVEALIEESGEIARLAPRILELRSQESGTIAVPRNQMMVDLKPLWLLAYGHELLEAAQVDLECHMSDFEEIELAFAKLGYEFEYKPGGFVPPVRMSNQLQKTIWWFVQARNNAPGRKPL